MDKEQIIAILEEHLSVTDEWGGSKIANWQYGFDLVVDGIDFAADAILKSASQQAVEADAESCAACEAHNILVDTYCSQCDLWKRTA